MGAPMVDLPWQAGGDMKEVRDYLDNHTSALQLRFVTGIAVRTEKHARCLVQWADRNDESLLDAGRCGPHFDAEIPALKQRSKRVKNRMIVLLGVAAMLIAVAAFVATTFIAENRVILQLNATKTWFTLSEKSAKPFFGGSTLEFAKCNRNYPDLYQPKGFTLSEITILCDSYKKVQRRNSIPT